MNVIGDFIAAFFEQPPRIVIVFALVIFGRVLKKNERLIDAKWIPVILPVIGIIAFPAALAEGARTIGRLAVEGFVGGCLAVWINQTYRQLFGYKSTSDPLEGDQLEPEEEKERPNAEHDPKSPNAMPSPVVHRGDTGGGVNVDANSGLHQPPEQNHS